MSFRYGRDYMSAISKLNAEDAYDEKGYLKDKFALTEKEQEALNLYVPELVDHFWLDDVEKPKGK